MNGVSGQTGHSSETSAQAASVEGVTGQVLPTGQSHVGAGDPWLREDPWSRAAVNTSRCMQPTPENTASGTSGSDYRGHDWSWQPWDWGSTWASGGWDASWGQPNHAWSWKDDKPKPDYSDPPSWPGWSHRKYWVQAVRRWNKTTDVPIVRRAEKVLRVLGWELQPDFEHLDDSLLTSEGFLDAIIEILNNKAGVREDDERRRAFRMAFSENQRKKDETLAQYAVRRQRDFRAAAGFGVRIPEDLQANMLREGAGLSEQNQQNLVALLQGKESDPDAVSRALGRLDIRSDRLAGFVDGAADAGWSESYVTEAEAVDDDDEELDEPALLHELETMDLTEDQINEVFAVLATKKRTWKENKLFKAEARRDRGSFMKGTGKGSAKGSLGGAPGTSGSGPGGRARMNREQLKKISRCRVCHEKGHWAEDCPNKKKDAGTAFAYLGAAAKGHSALNSASGVRRRWRTPSAWLAKSTLSPSRTRCSGTSCP